MPQTTIKKKIIFNNTSVAWHQMVPLLANSGVAASDGAMASGRAGYRTVPALASGQVPAFLAPASGALLVWPCGQASGTGSLSYKVNKT